MLTLEQIRTLLADRRPGAVAKAINVRTGTVIAIRDGGTANPSYAVVKALSDYLKEREA